MMIKQYFYKSDISSTLTKKLSTSHQKIQTKADIIQNGIVLPRKEGIGSSWGIGGVVDQDGNFVNSSAERGFGGKYEIDKNTIKDYQCEVIYLGYLIDHWGVFLVDFLRRIYWKFVNSTKRTKLAFCGIGFKEGTYGSIDKNCRELFSLIGISDDDIIDIRIPSRFKKVIIPEPGYEYDAYYNPNFVLPYNIAAEKVLSTRQDEYPELLYLSRMHFQKKKEAGERAIEYLFRKNGFTVIYPESLSVTEQISFFSQAKIIASIEGTIAHNVLFAQNAKNRLLFGNKKNSIQDSICLMKRKESKYSSLIVIERFLSHFLLIMI